MQVSIQHGEGLARSMTVELPSEEIIQEVEKRLKKLTRTVRMNGFRQGKVPYKLVYERYGLQMQNEVFNEYIESSINVIIDKEQLRLVNSPIVDKNVTQSDNKIQFSYTANFEVFPDIALASLESYTVRIPIATVTDEDVEEMLKSFCEQKRTWKVVERPACLGDKLITSMQIIGEDKLIKEVEKIPVELGAGTAIKELESGLIGTKAGETKAIELPLVSNQIENNPAMTLCNVTIHEVAEPIIPVLDYEFITAFGIASGDVQDLRKDVRKNMESSLAEYVRNNIKWQVMNVLIKAHQLLLPKTLVDLEIETLKADLAKDKQSNIPATWIEEQAKHRVALQLIIGEIIRQNAISLDVARVQNTIQTIANSYEDPESVFEYYRNPEKLQAIQNLVLEDQTVDWILTKVQVQEEASSFQKVTKSNLMTMQNKGVFSPDAHP